MTTSDAPSSERTLRAATSGSSGTILYAPTTSQMRHKFTFHQHGQLAHLNTIVLNYLQQQQRQEVIDENDTTQKQTIVICDTDDDDDGAPTADTISDTAITNVDETHRDSHKNATDMGDYDAPTKQESELERAREILNEYVEALRMSKTTAHTQKMSLSSLSSKQHHSTVSNSHADTSPKQSAVLEGTNAATPSRRLDGGAEGSVQQLRKRTLPLTLRPNVQKKPSPSGERED
jgi:hypothetical protein